MRGGALLDRMLDTAAVGLEARERAWTYELVYGVFRLRNRIDHILACHSSRSIDEIDPDTIDILRLGAYQLLEMDGVPTYAAVSESVELAKRFARRSAGFVNAVLQSLRRTPATSTFPALEQDPVAHLTTWGSHPRWMVERWIGHHGVDGARRLTEANNARPSLYLRALGPDVAEAVERLAERGVVTEPVAMVPRALRVVRGTVSDALAAAPVIVQDPAAGMVVGYIGDVPRRVLDLAAAPGGKAIALALDEPDADRLVIAADVSAHRLDRLVANLYRLRERGGPGDHGEAGEQRDPGRLRAGVATERSPQSVVPVVADGRDPPFRPADLVLLDAPCTGTGTFRRHPDGRWRIQPRDIAALATLQEWLLAAAARAVEPGGLLVYATCSLEPEENEAQVNQFLGQNSDFVLEPGPGAADDGLLRVLPQEHGVDGAFAARMRRAS